MPEEKFRGDVPTEEIKKSKRPHIREVTPLTQTDITVVRGDEEAKIQADFSLDEIGEDTVIDVLSPSAHQPSTISRRRETGTQIDQLSGGSAEFLSKKQRADEQNTERIKDAEKHFTEELNTSIEILLSGQKQYERWLDGEARTLVDVDDAWVLLNRERDKARDSNDTIKQKWLRELQRLTINRQAELQREADRAKTKII
jgi:hypothetical protein